MDSEFHLKQRLTNRRVIHWDPKFTKRNDITYSAENKRVVPQQGQSRVEAFLRRQCHGLLPAQYSYDALRTFLNRASVEHLEGTPDLDPSSKDAEKTILLDERKDNTPINKFTSRDWTEYAERPPEGTPKYTNILHAKGLFDRLTKDRIPTGAERRSIYIKDISPLCALALVLPVAGRYVPFLRDFLFRYVTSRVFFGVSIQNPITPASAYAFEFHLPYFALRRSPKARFPFRNNLGRRTGVFTDNFSNNCAEDEQECFHEAQISVLLVGIDEWVWTLYCLVDTHFSTESDDLNNYISNDFDAPSGRGAEYSSPVWNPREYFLLVMSRRMSQIGLEWSNIVSTLEQRLSYLEAETFIKPSKESALIEDPDFKLTNDYTWAIQVLQLFSNQLVKTIESWDTFAENQLQIFQPTAGSHTYPSKIPSFLGSLEADVSELRFLQRTLRQRIEIFDSRRSNILNASALIETRISNLQANNIGLLTKVTVLYLPLSLITAIFSMAFIPATVSWQVYLALVLPFTVITIAISFNLQRIMEGAKLFKVRSLSSAFETAQSSEDFHSLNLRQR